MYGDPVVLIVILIRECQNDDDGVDDSGDDDAVFSQPLSLNFSIPRRYLGCFDCSNTSLFKKSISCFVHDQKRDNEI